MAKSATTKNIAREMKMHIKLGHALAWSKQTDQGRTTMLHGREWQVALPPATVASAAPATTTTPSQRGDVLPESVETPVHISLAAAALLDSIIPAIEQPLASPAHDPTINTIYDMQQT
ncbi:hypothetical protein H257_16822 [Aphanomyces astaci]|uniref:Uncharacterized protein n=1 Tax=Aphanomyces astaci TaxID=112090 RepID=W4FIR2_APHAT|nr:hypothetical protein H257_16822 [Aphanomyces astaci]ETV66721.1 hypothetical protein H257_16822 [Aphanomyces astaci]|eukprot:XP_009843697.1 hypothetical protein H257_16822 [Aphanomyces astaci]